MKKQEELVLKQDKQYIKNNIIYAKQTQESIQELSKKENKMGFSQDQLENSTHLLKSINSFVESLKNHYANLKQITKQQLSLKNNKKNNQNILLTETVKLINSRFSLGEVLKQLKQDISQSEIQILSFSELENSFISEAFKSFEITAKMSQEQPKALLEGITLIRERELMMNELHLPSLEMENLIEKINSTINCRFEENIGQNQDSLSILNNINFIVSDMEIVEKHIQKCFPQEMKIFNVYESKYRQNLELKIQKDIQDDNQLKEKFEVLNKLIEWISNYEQQMVKVGGQPMEFSYLKSSLMKYMPLFQDHIKQITSQYFSSTFQDDIMNLSVEQLDRCIYDNIQIKLSFPTDCFHYLNLQIDTICSKFEINQYIEWIRQIGGIIQESIIDQLKESITNQVQEIKNKIDIMYDSNQANLSDVKQEEKQLQRDCNLLIAKIVILINSMYECEKFSMDTMDHSLQNYKSKCQDYHKERIIKIFREDIKQRCRQFNDYLQHQILTIICDQINAQIMPNIFNQNIDRLNDSISLTISTQVESNVVELIERMDYYFKLMKRTLNLNNLYCMNINKLLLQSITNLYWNQIAEEIKREYVEEEDLFQLIFQISSCIFKEFSPKTKKDNEIKVTSLFSAHNNFDLLAKRIENDMEILSKYLNNSSYLQISQKTIQSLLNQFAVFIKSIQTQNSQIQLIISPIYLSFPKDISQQIFTTILNMRQELSSRQKKQWIEKFESYNSSPNINPKNNDF